MTTATVGTISYGAPVADMAIRLRQHQGAEITVHEAGSGKALRKIVVIEAAGGRGDPNQNPDVDGRGRALVAQVRCTSPSGRPCATGVS